ncbi:MAG TPA: type II toxin-antitoxin system RelE/ParE family toxin [Lacipirellulaceae bacterium]|jgi:plasmid stabilization system protein ParE
MSRLLVTSAAEHDFTESLAWYAGRSQQAAGAFDAEFDRVLKSIRLNPNRFPLCDERHRYAIMHRFPFQVIFREQGDRWAVIAVAHAKRSPGYWASR